MVCNGKQIACMCVGLVVIVCIAFGTMIAFFGPGYIADLIPGGECNEDRSGTGGEPTFQVCLKLGVMC